MIIPEALAHFQNTRALKVLTNSPRQKTSTRQKRSHQRKETSLQENGVRKNVNF